jgi:predicted metalloprotease
MRWGGGRRSENIEDRRDEGGGTGMRFPGGFRPLGGGRIPGGRGGGLGLVGIVVVVAVSLFLGVDPGAILTGGLDTGMPPGTQDQVAGAPADGPRGAEDDRLADFVSVVLADTEDTWRVLFAAQGGAYQEPKLVLFRRAVRSACGMAGAAAGPFYCPGDQRVYIDLSFYDEMKTRFGAPGDFAQAYVIAHEVGHHVQNLLGIAGKVRQAQARASTADANNLSVRMELQADCFAGVWAHNADRARGIIEAGDVEEALNAAAAIGDDRLQRQAQGHVVPESFTHGSSAQRQRWFRRGLDSGTLTSCDTFGAATP